MEEPHAEKSRYIRLVFFYKCLHGLVAIDLSKDLIPQTRETRGNHSQSYICPSDTRNYVNYSFLPRTIVQWNKLPEIVVTLPQPGHHPELSGCITTLIVRNTGGCKLWCCNRHLDRSRCLDTYREGVCRLTH